MTFAEKLVQLRKREGYTQEEVADRLEVSRQAISRWEMGTAVPDSSNLLQISKLFKVSADYLLNDDYESDDDLPKVKEVKNDNVNQIMMYLIVLEVMMLIMQFMAVVILNSRYLLVAISKELVVVQVACIAGNAIVVAHIDSLRHLLARYKCLI